LPRYIGNTIEDIESRVNASRGEVKAEATAQPVAIALTEGVHRPFLTSLSLLNIQFLAGRITNTKR
jgi:hypothetical protein